MVENLDRIRPRHGCLRVVKEQGGLPVCVVDRQNCRALIARQLVQAVVDTRDALRREFVQ